MDQVATQRCHLALRREHGIKAGERQPTKLAFPLDRDARPQYAPPMADLSDMNILRGRFSSPWQSINSIVEIADEYINCFGFLRGTFFLAARRSRLYPIGKTVLATVPGSDIQLLVRLGTPDIQVFNEIYHEKEHDWNFEVAPETILDAGAYTGCQQSTLPCATPALRS